LFETITFAISSAKTLTEIVGNLSNVKVRNELTEKIIDLQSSLLKARQEMLDIQDKYEQVLRENKALKEASAPKEKPRVHWGCYKFEGDEGLYCTGCYDTTGKKIMTNRLNIRQRFCPVCKSSFGAG
jgi:hypothetical protein